MSTAYSTPQGDDVWMLNPNLLLVITDQACHLVNGSPSDIEALRQDLIEQGNLNDGRLAKARTIPFKKIMLICGDEKSRKLQIRHFSLAATVTTQGVKMTDLEFTDVETLRGVAASFQQRFGPDGKLTRKEFTPARALVAPVVTAAFIGLMTYFGARGVAESTDFQAKGRHRAAKELVGRLLVFLGPTGTAVVGLILILICAVWAVKRLRNPPIMITLKPGKLVNG